MEINNQEDIPISTEQNNTLNQNFQYDLGNDEQIKEKKSIKFDPNSVIEIPIEKKYNLRYGDDINGYNELDPQTKKIINDPKYANEKRSKSAFSKKSFREKYESMKIKIPSNKDWNRDPTAEIIIRNLEQKIDILTYENFLLSKKLREIENSNKELKLNISRNLMIIKAEQEINSEENNKNNLKDENNLKNFDKDKKNKKNKKDKKEKDVDLFEELNKLKEENDRLRLSNQNLAENNAELNKAIDILKNEINLNKEGNIDENKNDDKIKISNNQFDKNQNIIINENENNDNNLEKNINTENDAKMADEQNNSAIDINKYLANEEQYHELIEENELLHKKLRSLLLIDGDSKINTNKNLFSLSGNSFNNLKSKENIDTQKDELTKENYILKQKIRALNSELNKMAVENNRKLLIIQDRLDEYEAKQKQNLNKFYENERNKKKDEELDEILNETLLVMNQNQDDEESKRMIETIKNIKNEQKKRISQCLIINNKLKSLLQENAQLHNKLLLSKKENEIFNNTNSNSNNTNMSNINNSFTNPHICFCGNGNYSVNAMKIRDEMIIKYKDKIDDSNEFLRIPPNQLNNNNIEKEMNLNRNIKVEKNEGFEDYLLGKIVNNQKEVLGERAPRFYENNNNNKYLSKSVQNDDNDNFRMNNRYNNYHYRKRIIEEDE